MVNFAVIFTDGIIKLFDLSLEVEHLVSERSNSDVLFIVLTNCQFELCDFIVEFADYVVFALQLEVRPSKLLFETKASFGLQLLVLSFKVFELVDFGLKLMDLILQFFFVEAEAEDLFFDSAFAEGLFFLLLFSLLNSHFQLSELEFEVVSLFVVVVFVSRLK